MPMDKKEQEHWIKKLKEDGIMKPGHEVYFKDIGNGYYEVNLKDKRPRKVVVMNGMTEEEKNEIYKEIMRKDH